MKKSYSSFSVPHLHASRELAREELKEEGWLGATQIAPEVVLRVVLKRTIHSDAVGP